MKIKKLQIAVIGSAGVEEYEFEKPKNEMYKIAEQIGFSLAKNNCYVINGGKGGVMEAVCRGCSIGGGISVGEISANGRGQGNKFLDIEVVTYDIGYRGPSQLIGMSDGIISIGGGAGTLQELAVAYRMKKPVVLIPGYGGWTDRIAELEWLDERRLIKFEQATTAEQAVKRIIRMVK